ncbi:MAG: hypothetical protein DHS20C18_49690 [Saprospiraceae bacterium]|nr:MAG: hypothetical protein DHS20C18_49690 [Saprospiraceae bacterium]
MNFLALLIILTSVLILPIGIWFVLRRLKIKQAWGALLFGGILALFFLGLWIYEVGGGLRQKHYRQISEFLHTDWQLPAYETTDWESSLMTMSAFAEGLADYGQRYPDKRAEVQELLDKIVLNTTQEQFFPDINKMGNWKNQNFYLSQLNIILGAFEQNDSAGTYTNFQEKVSTYLAQAMTKSSYRHLLSFPKGNKYWVSDNAAILYGLGYFDSQMQASLGFGPSKDWGGFVNRELMYRSSSMPCSAFTTTNKCMVMPTGNHLAWTIAYISKSQKPFAKNTWRKYKHFFKHNFLWIWASASYYHPDDEAPAYISQSQRFLERAKTSPLALRAAAHIGDRLSYHQLNNRLLLVDMFRKKAKVSKDWEQWFEVGVRFSAECFR